MMTGAKNCPLHTGGQRLYYRSYKAEAVGQKALVSLVFHHGYGCYCGFYDKGRVEKVAQEMSRSYLSALITCLSIALPMLNRMSSPYLHPAIEPSLQCRLQDTAEEGLQRICV